MTNRCSDRWSPLASSADLGLSRRSPFYLFCHQFAVGGELCARGEHYLPYLLAIFPARRCSFHLHQWCKSAVPWEFCRKHGNTKCLSQMHFSYIFLSPSSRRSSRSFVVSRLCASGGSGCAQFPSRRPHSWTCSCFRAQFERLWRPLWSCILHAACQTLISYIAHFNYRWPGTNPYWARRPPWDYRWSISLGKSAPGNSALGWAGR